jgi:hypothetical protein
MSLRKAVVWFTLVCFVTTQTASVAGPHEEGVAAGQAANPVARGSVTAPSATGVVPGYTTTPPERSYYRQPNLASQGNARLALCATLPNDPTCQAQRGALASANTPRPAVSPDDPAVAAARDIGRSPSSVLGSLAAYYSGCTTTVTNQPATTQTRSCLRYLGVGNYSCARSLTVATDRTTSCTPGDWFAHAGSGRAGIDVAMPSRPAGNGAALPRHAGQQPADLLRREHDDAGGLPRDGRGAGDELLRHDRSADPHRRVGGGQVLCRQHLQPDRDDRRRGAGDLHRQRRLGLQLHQRRALPEDLRGLPLPAHRAATTSRTPCVRATTAARRPCSMAPSAMRRPAAGHPTPAPT